MLRGRVAKCNDARSVCQIMMKQPSECVRTTSAMACVSADEPASVCALDVRSDHVPLNAVAVLSGGSSKSNGSSSGVQTVLQQRAVLDDLKSGLRASMAGSKPPLAGVENVV